MPMRSYILIQEVTKIYNITVEAESQEEAANIGMRFPIEEWTDLGTGSAILTYVTAEPKGISAVNYRRQKWSRSKDRWVRRKLSKHS